ncbi:hypothetical protein [Teredinibacter sp. KSP-S5-2]|uniref:hypothetical protein n=1 Tax=Teredinibacter sp. KSP-S5-2 TaxID=3034506 RepID=UPI00293422F7|nr:hypothetical protein [Teredinibacter sp. KSP-S5-2]WNO10452.1 hypothetical protein P5V12_04635 [Teredinibacter sp. KSP-S5-2]
MAVYKYCLDDHYHHATGIAIPKTVEFHDQNGQLRMLINQQGVITIYKSYAWDGCSPKIKIFDVGYLGTPDGALHDITGKPKTYYASLVHDALCQFLDHPNMPFSKSIIDAQLLMLLRESEFSLSWVYFIVVRVLGGVYGWLKQALF